MEHPDYYRCREQLITFLEERAHKRTSPQVQIPASSAGGVEDLPGNPQATPAPIVADHDQEPALASGQLWRA